MTTGDGLIGLGGVLLIIAGVTQHAPLFFPALGGFLVGWALAGRHLRP